MAEDAVVKEALTEGMIASGAALVRQLDAMQWPVEAAFWYFRPESNDWKLYLASGEVAAVGPLAAYGKIQQAIALLSPGTDDLTLSHMVVVPPGSPLLRALRSAVLVEPAGSLQRLRMKRNMFNGVYFEDLLIYRLT